MALEFDAPSHAAERLLRLVADYAGVGTKLQVFVRDVPDVQFKTSDGGTAFGLHTACRAIAATAGPPLAGELLGADADSQAQVMKALLEARRRGIQRQAAARFVAARRSPLLSTPDRRPAAAGGGVAGLPPHPALHADG